MIAKTNSNDEIKREVKRIVGDEEVIDTYVKTDFQADTASDIATMNDAANGYLNYPAGSMVICLGNGKIYMLDGTNHEYLEFKSGGSSRSKADLSRSVENCSVSVTVSGSAVTDGINALSVGASATITATANEGYTMSTLTVNGESHTSGQAITVSGDVVIEAVATETPVEEWEQIWSASNCAFTTYQGQAGFIMYQDGESAFSAISDLNTTDDFKIEITELSLSAETKFTVEDGTYYSAMGQEYNVMGTFGANLVMVLGQNTTEGSYTIKLYKKTQ